MPTMTNAELRFQVQRSDGLIAVQDLLAGWTIYYSVHHGTVSQHVRWERGGYDSLEARMAAINFLHGFGF